MQGPRCHCSWRVWAKRQRWCLQESPCWRDQRLHWYWRSLWDSWQRWPHCWYLKAKRQPNRPWDCSHVGAGRLPWFCLDFHKLDIDHNNKKPLYIFMKFSSTESSSIIIQLLSTIVSITHVLQVELCSGIGWTTHSVILYFFTVQLWHKNVEVIIQRCGKNGKNAVIF
jgi:hypothetical protein